MALAVVFDAVKRNHKKKVNSFLGLKVLLKHTNDLGIVPCRYGKKNW